MTTILELIGRALQRPDIDVASVCLGVDLGAWIISCWIEKIRSAESQAEVTAADEWLMETRLAIVKAAYGSREQFCRTVSGLTDDYNQMMDSMSLEEIKGAGEMLRKKLAK